MRVITWSGKGGLDNKAMDFDSYVQSKGYNGRIPAAVAKQLHSAWIKESAGGWQPQALTVTNPVTQEVVPVLTTSPNSVAPMRDTQPKVSYKADKDGNLYAIEGTSAAAVTNKMTGEPVKVDPRANRLDDLIGQMGQALEQQGVGIGGWSSSWMPGSGKPAASPAPLPAPSPAASPAAQTNAPAPVAAPAAFQSPDDVVAAAKAGKLSKAQAQEVLVKQFGFAP